MSPWHLEALRLWRTRRLIALVSVFVILGLGLPILSYYLPELVKSGSNGVQVVVPKQTPADSMAGFGHNAAQLGSLVIVVMAAATLAIDARPALAAFYRSRVRSPWVLLVPRAVALSLAATLALGLGILCAWYETAVLIDPLRGEALAAGFGLGALWVCFCVGVVALWASIARGVLPTAGASLGSLIVLSFISSFDRLSSWSPTAIDGSVANFVGPHHVGAPWHAVVVTILVTVALVGIAIWRFARRAI